MPSLDALQAASAALHAASRALAAAEILISEILDETMRAESGDVSEIEAGCRHLRAMEIQTFGDGAPLWLCPDCDETLS